MILEDLHFGVSDVDVQCTFVPEFWLRVHAILWSYSLWTPNSHVFARKKVGLCAHVFVWCLYSPL